MKIEICPLCFTPASVFNADKNQCYLQCTHCKGIFMQKSSLPTADAELNRYKLHQNDINDEGYRNFARPLYEAVLKNVTPLHAGLDFGAGPSSVICEMLSQKSYNIKPYDPFFFNDSSLLNQTYDYIICCEVIEHFHYPAEAFSLLYHLLKPGGMLICKTALFTPQTNFATWYYKNDFTHVFFYTPETLNYIHKAFMFSKLINEEGFFMFIK